MINTLLFVLTIFMVESTILPLSVENHFWRDFNGLIPPDAISAGVNAQGVKVYVGQTVLGRLSSGKWDVLPAVITHGSKVVVAPYQGKVLNSTDEACIKIMCAPYLPRYYWFSPKDVVPPSCRFVVAGREDANPLYVGRTKVENGTVIGKYFSDDRFVDLIAPFNGDERFFSTYEILTYCN